MANISPWYVTGFCDGEAAFTYSRGSGSFSICFSIKQREDNKQIIEDIWEYFGHAGYIYQSKGSLPTRYSGNTKSSIIYRVTKIEELLIILDHFDQYPPQSKKKLESYNIWREMVLYKSQNYRSASYDILRELAEKLSASNSKSRAFKVHTR